MVGLANAKAVHARLTDDFALSEADAAMVRTNLESWKVRFSEVEQASKLVSANPDDARTQSGELAKRAEKPSRQLTKMSSKVQLLESEVSFLKTQMYQCSNTHDDSIRTAAEHS